MTVLHYEWPEVRADYWRAAAGMALTGIPLLLVRPGAILFWVLLAMFALFAVFGFRTLMRHRMEVDAGPDVVTRRGGGFWGSFSRSVDLAKLRRMKLRYFSPRRDRRDGWMQLRLWDDRTALSVDTALAGFETVLEHAVSAAARNRLVLDPSTRANLAGLGVRVRIDDETGALEP